MTRFEKVSKKQYEKALDTLLAPHLSYSYDDIKTPVRATTGSSGYDFFAPFDFSLNPGETITIPTGIRMKTDHQIWLLCMPRSGLGFKYRMQLDNTVGNIDSDYWKSDNEGHIMAKITNDSRQDKTLDVKAGMAFMQGVILPYMTVDDDTACGDRNGGFGSTGGI